MGADGAVTAGAEAASLGMSSPQGPQPCREDAILLVLRTGMQWNALDGTAVCACASTYRRFREWTDAGVFEAFWRRGLLECDETKGIDWSWLALDGTMTKAPLGGEKNRPQPMRPRQRRRQAPSPH